MALSMVSWGVAWANAKVVNEYFDFYDLVFLRFLFGALSLLPLLFFNKNKFSLKIQHIKYIIPASLMFLLYNLSFFMGTHYGAAGKGAVFATTTNPIITLILMAILTRTITKSEVLGILVGFVGGILIMDIFRMGIGDMFSRENIFFPACSVLWGVVTIMISYAQKKVPPLQFIFYCYLFTAIISAPFTTITGEELASLDTRFYLNFFMVSIASMAFGTSVYMYATNIIGPVKSSVFIFSVPFIALLSAYIMLDEPVYLSTIIGGIICISSIFIVNKNNNNKEVT